MFYFAYGSNLLRRRIEQRLGRCRLHAKGQLGGYVLSFHKTSLDGSGKCTVHKTGNGSDTVHGGVFKLTSTQKLKLDDFEGRGYDCSAVVVQTRQGSLEVETYIAKPQSIDCSLIPFDWYKAFVVEGAKEVGLPIAYISRLESTETQQDPDWHRAQTN